MGYVFNLRVPAIGEGKDSYVNPDNPDDFEVDAYSFNTDTVISISKNVRSTSIQLDISILYSSNISILVERKYCIDLETYKILKEYIIDTYDKISYCMMLDSLNEKTNNSEDAALYSLLKSVGILPAKKY